MAALLLAVLPWSAPVHAYSLRPLVTEEVEPLPSGVAQATLGIAYSRNGTFPLFTPPDTLQSQDVVNVPQFAFRIGAGGWVEIQAAYELVYNHEDTTDGQSMTNYGSGDGSIFTKVRLFREREILPALGVSFGAKLPNGVREDHLGTDATDLAGMVLATKAIGPVSVHSNLGLGILGVPAPTTSGGQDDVLLYSVAVVSRPLGGDDSPDATRFTLMGEVAGIANSHHDYDNNRSSIRAGLQVVHGAATVYLGVSTGLISASEEFGASAGFTYTFDVTKVLAE